MARGVKCGLTTSRVTNCRPLLIAGSTAAGSKRAEEIGRLPPVFPSHSGIERGFIRAEVVACKALLELKTLAHCRDKGLLRLEGKEYLVADGDVINFRFNV